MRGKLSRQRGRGKDSGFTYTVVGWQTLPISSDQIVLSIKIVLLIVTAERNNQAYTSGAAGGYVLLLAVGYAE